MKIITGTHALPLLFLPVPLLKTNHIHCGEAGVQHADRLLRSLTTGHPARKDRASQGIRQENPSLNQARNLLEDQAKKAVSLLDEFKNFALKGNVVDLAIGVIIAAAFGIRPRWTHVSI